MFEVNTTTDIRDGITTFSRDISGVVISVTRPGHVAMDVEKATKLLDRKCIDEIGLDTIISTINTTAKRVEAENIERILDLERTLRAERNKSILRIMYERMKQLFRR